jgi:serine/threonine-protein kinase RsbT
VTEQSMQIAEEQDIVIVRNAVRRAAEQGGFDTFAIAALTTAASELSRNIFRHARRGRATIRAIDADARRGLQILFEDEGPGIADVSQAMKDGFSTAGSLGLGLSGSKRLVDEFDIESTVGHGTRVTIVKWRRS